MSDNIMMKLGTFTFSVNTATYQNMTRTTGWRWQSQERIGREPAYQFGGPGADSITLSGTIYPHYKGGLGQLDGMRAEAGQGQPLILMTGTGKNAGKWVIQQVDETQTAFMNAGIAQKLEFSMQLTRYGEDI